MTFEKVLCLSFTQVCVYPCLRVPKSTTTGAAHTKKGVTHASVGGEGVSQETLGQLSVFDTFTYIPKFLEHR